MYLNTYSEQVNSEEEPPLYRSRDVSFGVKATTLPTHNKLSVEEVDSFVIPGILILKVHSVQHVLDKCHGNHRQQDGILQMSDTIILHSDQAREKQFTADHGRSSLVWNFR